MTTGERMKARRKALHLNAEEVAFKLGVSAATIYRYEKGDIEKVPSTILDPLAIILHTTPQYLMGWTENPAPEATDTLSSEETELIRYYRAADPVFRVEALEMLKRHQK